MKVTREEYRLIIAGAAQGRSLEETEGIDDVLSRMKENVEFIDKWTNLNGSLRKAPMKKQREIEKMELFLTDEDLRKIRSMPDPLASFDRPEEHMTVYRSDGSSVSIRSEFGTVQITDTRKKGTIISMDAEQAVRFMSGETIPGDARGWVLMMYEGLAAGWGKGSEGTIKNHYPKGLRGSRFIP